MNPEDIGALLAGSGILVVMLLSLIGVIIPIVAYWKIIGKTGHPAPLALVILFPFAGLILLYWLALSEWPVLRRAQAPVPGPPMPAPAPPSVQPVALAAATSDAPQPRRFCTGCGVGLEGIERFCANCGKPV